MKRQKTVTFGVRIVVPVRVSVELDIDDECFDPECAGELARIVGVQNVGMPDISDITQAIAEDPESFDDAVAEAFGVK